MYDAVIIGGGHNGLVCAAYLGLAGLKVVVLERRPVVGGAAVTEEFAPGYRNSIASYTVSLLSPKVMAELDLVQHGLHILERPLANFLPLDDGRYLQVGEGHTQQEVAKFSVRDAERLKPYHRHLGSLADCMRGLLLTTPPNVGEPSLIRGLADLLKAGKLMHQLGRLGRNMQRDLLDLITTSAGTYLDHWFESAPIKAVYGFDSIVGNYASPYTPGSAYVLLHHCLGEVNGKKGLWGHAVGGMGAISQAIAKAAAAHGVEVRVNTPVREVVIERGRAIGVRTEQGNVVCAAAVVANVNPKLLYLELIDRATLPAGFGERIAKWRCGSGSFRMNLALSELPNFSALPGRELGLHHMSGIIIGPSSRLHGGGLFRRTPVRVVTATRG